MNETLYDTAATARILGLTEGTLRKWRSAGCGPIFLKLGRAIRYRASDIEVFTSARAFNSTDDFGRIDR